MKEKNNVRVINTPSIEHTLRPIACTSWLLGAGVARPRNSSKAITIIKCIVYLSVYTVHLVYAAIEFITDKYAIGSGIVDFVCVMYIVTFHISAYYNVYHGIKQYEKWPELMDRMKELDRKIKRETSLNDRPVKNMEALAILTTFAWCTLAPIADILYHYLTNLDVNMYVAEILDYYVEAQLLMNSLVFDIVVYVIYYRFKTINKLIGQLNDSVSHPSWITLKITRIRELHTGIYQVVNMVNDIYGLCLLFYSTNCFVMTASTLFEIYVEVLEKDYTYILMNNIFWIMQIAQFGLMCWICTLARQESDKIGRSMYEIVHNRKLVNFGKINKTRNQSSLEIYPPFEDLDIEQNSSSGHNLNVVLENLSRKNLDLDCVKKEINEFSIQLQLYRVAFTACDFFEINNALFSGFVGTIITYLIIYIQFYQQPKNLD